METDVGSLLYPSSDEVITPFVRENGWWEKEESAALRSLLRPGMTFVDVGAHVGYLTLVAAERVGPTGRGLAVEPVPDNFALLQANILWTGTSWVDAIPVAAWNENRRLTITLSADNSGDHRAYAAGEERGADAEPWPGRWTRTESREVLAVALDEIVPPDTAIDVVKIDVQGCDHLVIRGMERTLTRCHPSVLVEFWPEGIAELGGDPADVISYYGLFGFQRGVIVASRSQFGRPA
ncbi:MAG: FkbM family methyltransferase [Actinomycetota bacterium]|nr:FkbM family methyltransferase [Actinomycetota bacterium]